MPPIIDQEKCLECDECSAMDSCPQEVLEGGMHDEPFTVVRRPEDCIGCGMCMDNCNGNAITLEK